MLKRWVQIGAGTSVLAVIPTALCRGLLRARWQHALLRSCCVHVPLEWVGGTAGHPPGGHALSPCRYASVVGRSWCLRCAVARIIHPIASCLCPVCFRQTGEPHHRCACCLFMPVLLVCCPHASSEVLPQNRLQNLCGALLTHV